MINVSDSALSQLQELVRAESSPVGLRVFVQPGGCSGFSYGMGLDENPPRQDDEIVELGDLKVYVDSFSAQYLDGAEIDFVDQLMGGGFTIRNPNAVASCSCGHSFDTGDNGATQHGCGCGSH